ncbi:hypothetical protein GQX73_g9465 [Xylaria multiplex]|uniref:Uncharacterized protein n=1 Tax=Xylaria multiplex TaxID=323545 RepID=A0A7C8IHW2_9PEZI|nr:hypothetical protein GQX73_g9465 [Xylaria multiplex]
MDDSIDPNNPPSSPWATRYPINKFTFKSENTRHSYFAPEYPRIDDPKYYDQEPDPVIILHPHNDEEKDKVLWSEMVQRTEFWGMRTWELAALNRHLRFSRRTGFISGGHRLADGKKTEFPGFLVPPRTSSLSGRRTMPAILSANEERDYSVFEKERIRVNESEWLPFLRKDRWFDWIHMDPGASKSSGDIGPEPKTWSVDDPKFLNAEGIAEAGHYMENVFFGGIFVVEPESLGTPERPHPPPLLKIFRNWPYANYTGKPAAPNSDFKKDGYINVSYHVPSTWISKILSESFWRDRRFPRKSENHFHRNPIFVLENQKIGGYSDRRINGEVLAADLTTLKYRYDEDEVAIDDWSTRLHTWDDAREIW